MTEPITVRVTTTLTLLPADTAVTAARLAAAVLLDLRQAARYTPHAERGTVIHHEDDARPVGMVTAATWTAAHVLPASDGDPDPRWLHPITGSNPLSAQPPYDEFDAAEQARPGDTGQDTDRRRRANRLDILLHACAGLELSAFERRILLWLTDWDAGTVATVASLLHRARAAGHTVAVLDRLDGEEDLARLLPALQDARTATARAVTALLDSTPDTAHALQGDLADAQGRLAVTWAHIGAVLDRLDLPGPLATLAGHGANDATQSVGELAAIATDLAEHAHEIPGGEG